MESGKHFFVGIRNIGYLDFHSSFFSVVHKVSII